MKTDGESSGLASAVLLEVYISHACPSGLLFRHLQNELNEQRLTEYGHARPGRRQPEGPRFRSLSHGAGSRDVG